jgi:hypothetical protein
MPVILLYEPVKPKSEYVMALTALQYQFPPISLAEPEGQACALIVEMVEATTAAVTGYFIVMATSQLFDGYSYW